MRFTGWCLAVRENGAIVSGQNIGDNRLCRFIVHLLLGGIWFEYFIEQINFSLFDRNDTQNTHISIKMSKKNSFE